MRKDRGPSPVDSLRADPDPTLGGGADARKRERERSQSRWFRKCSDARTTHRSVGQDSRRAVLDDAGTALRPPAWGRFVQSVRGKCCFPSLSLSCCFPSLSLSRKDRGPGPVHGACRVDPCLAHSSARGPSHARGWVPRAQPRPQTLGWRVEEEVGCPARRRQRAAPAGAQARPPSAPTSPFISSERLECAAQASDSLALV